jgi:hypothetical protein
MEPTSSNQGTQDGRRFGRSPIDAVDLAPERRPGVPAERPPQPWPNSRFPPERMRAPSAVPKHGRPGKEMPPVYGTAVPLRGVSGAIRGAAYRYPDHVATHWLLMLLGDRVDAWGTRAWRVARVAVPVGVVALVATRVMGRARG